MLWRDSGRVIRFFTVDGRAASGLLLVLLHISWETVLFAISLMIFFAVLERFDYTLPNAVRKARSTLDGKKRYAIAPFRRKMYRSQ